MTTFQQPELKARKFRFPSRYTTSRNPRGDTHSGSYVRASSVHPMLDEDLEFQEQEPPAYTNAQGRSMSVQPEDSQRIEFDGRYATIPSHHPPLPRQHPPGAPLEQDSQM